MFTGLIEEVGTVAELAPRLGGLDLEIAAERILEDIGVDDSVAVNGVCLTVVELSTGGFRAQAVAETVQRTTLKAMQTGCKVNLERALLPNRRLGGHFVQGHVDGVGQIIAIVHEGDSEIIKVRLSREHTGYVVPKGSIALDGVSLTVADILEDVLQVWIIPHTLATTTLGQKRTGEFLNVELDLIGKYVARLPDQQGPGQNLTEGLMKEWGF